MKYFGVVALAAIIAMVRVSQSLAQPTTRNVTAAAGNLKWKCAWPFGLPARTAEDALKAIDMVKAVGFNVLVVNSGRVEFTKNVIKIGREKDVAIYLAVNPVYGEWGWHLESGVQAPSVECLQEYDDLKRLNTATQPDEVVYAGPWLCIDRPEVRKFAAEQAVAYIKAYDPDGLALDFIGYKNFEGCECEYSTRQRAKFAEAHPGLSVEQAAKEFSLDSLTTMYQEVRDAAVAANPRIKLAAHVYPPFEYEPIYGNRLALDYPAQTVSWFFSPHWNIEKVADRCEQIKETEATYHVYTTGTAFIGVYTDEKNVKSPERIHAELSTIKQANLCGFCVAGDMGFLKDTPQARALSEELGGTLHLQPATSPAPDAN